MISNEQFVGIVVTRLGDGRAVAEFDGGLYRIRLDGIEPGRVIVVDDDGADQHFACIWWPAGDLGVPETRQVTEDRALVRQLADAAMAATTRGVGK